MGNKVVVGIHQPNFIPWPSYFNKISKSDIFIFLDDVEFTKNSLINRNSIKSNDKELRLTVPVAHRSMRQLISETEIANHKSIKKIWKTRRYWKNDFVFIFG